MNRREFAKWAGASLASLGSLSSHLSLVANGEQPTTDGGRVNSMVEPVNVADFQRLAESKLPRATYEYITTGSADEITLRENVAAFQRVRILPPLLTGVERAHATTTVLKQSIAFPILLAPVAGQQMYHREGGVGAARAAASLDTVYCMSSSVGSSVEQIGAAGDGPKWFQLYAPKDRAIAKQLVQRAERAGFRAIILTVDLGEWKDADRRNRFALPKDVLIRHLNDLGFHQITDAMSYQEIMAFNAQAFDLGLKWDYFDWLRGITKLPLLIKGVLRNEDAQRAVSIGIDGIIVSNHGGRRLDGMPASLEVLPEIVSTVKGRAEVYLDGGVRRGTDVLIALALGARAVLIGRPYAWALAADGEDGVRKVLELLRDEFLNAMVSTGCAQVSDIRSSLLRINGQVAR
jgi:isopentenyl diphosphate isomerase/L-lactate dehydrogenase-like FMN-dependent dehydrogenase